MPGAKTTKHPHRHKKEKKMAKHDEIDRRSHDDDEDTEQEHEEQEQPEAEPAPPREEPPKESKDHTPVAQGGKCPACGWKWGDESPHIVA